eukprot:6157052-Amphidinium_carterae.1
MVIWSQQQSLKAQDGTSCCYCSTAVLPASRVSIAAEESRSTDVTFCVFVRGFKHPRDVEEDAAQTCVFFLSMFEKRFDAIDAS